MKPKVTLLLLVYYTIEELSSIMFIRLLQASRNKLYWFYLMLDYTIYIFHQDLKYCTMSQCWSYRDLRKALLVFNNSTKQRNYAWLLQFTFIIRKPFHVNFVSPSFYSQLEVCKIILFSSFANCSPSTSHIGRLVLSHCEEKQILERKGKSDFSLLLTQHDHKI